MKIQPVNLLKICLKCTAMRYSTLGKIARVENPIKLYPSYPLNSSANSSPTFGQRWLQTTSSSYSKTRDDRKSMYKSLPDKDEGILGEKSVDVDVARSVSSLFPDENTPDMVVNGVKFSNLYICHVKVSKNNTLLLLSDHKEGFKNAKKGTNIAAQAAGFAMGNRSIAMGIKDVRVKIKGLGPGRMASIQGLQLSGMNIVSITDGTPSSFTPPRGQKQRKL